MPKVIRIYEYGGPECLRYESLPLLPPQQGQVTIAVKAIGLNRSEIMFRSGRHIEQAEFPARLGYEAAGIVEALGEGVKGFSVGDAVSLIPPPSITRWGTYSEMITVPAEFVVRHPANLSFVEAAAVWMACITAYGVLIDVAGLKDGDIILSLAASSSVGLACFQIAKLVGATVIATTRTEGKRQALIDAGADHVVVTDHEDLENSVKAITHHRGVRVVLDPVGGPGIQAVAATMAQNGILIAYGALDMASTPMPLFAMIAKGLLMRGFTFKAVVLDRERRERARTFILDQLAAGCLKPTISKVFRFSEMAEAHRYLESNQQFGKIVVTMD